MKIIFVLFLFYINTVLHSQSPVYPQRETVKFSFFEGLIADTNKLTLTIKYTNLEKDAILIPVNLVEGDRLDPYSNIYTELQTLVDGKYERFKDKFVDHFLIGDSFPGPKRAYNKLKPGGSAFINFNLISRIGAFYKGKYRMRVHLLNVPINGFLSILQAHREDGIIQISILYFNIDRISRSVINMLIFWPLYLMALYQSIIVVRYSISHFRSRCIVYLVLVIPVFAFLVYFVRELIITY